MFSNKLSNLKRLLDLDDEYMDLYNLNIDEELEEVIDEENIDNTDKLFFERKNTKPKPVTNLKVEPIIKEADDYIYINDHLPKIPFSLLCAGARGSGKSVLTLSLIEKLYTYFDEIIIFSPTIELDNKYQLLFDKLKLDFEVGKNIFYSYNEGILSKILSKVKKVNKNKPFKDKVKVLMIFDDIISQIPKNMRKTKFNRLLFNNRHYNISIIINSQSLKLLDSNFRKNSSQVCLFKSFNILELKNYMEEFSALLGNTTRERQENFMKIFNYATSSPHSFLYINTHNEPNIFFKNLEELINVPDIVSKPLDFYLPDILRKKNE